MQKYYTITANAVTDDDNSILFKGTISYDGASVNGTWKSTNGTSGNFVMYLDDAYGAFNGNMGGGVPFCGNRVNSQKPNPCLN
jgi:hypothetical protein